MCKNCYLLQTFVQATYAVATFVHIINILIFLGSYFFGPTFIQTQFFWRSQQTPNFFKTFLGPKIYLGPKNFSPHNFLGSEMFLDPNFFVGSNIILTQNFFQIQNFFSDQMFFLDLRLPQCSHYSPHLWESSECVLFGPTGQKKVCIYTKNSEF